MSNSLLHLSPKITADNIPHTYTNRQNYSHILENLAKYFNFLNDESTRF